MYETDDRKEVYETDHKKEVYETDHRAVVFTASPGHVVHFPKEEMGEVGEDGDGCQR